jgi:hypothetical protein
MAVGAEMFLVCATVRLLVPVQVPLGAESDRGVLSTTRRVSACMLLDMAAPMLPW